MASLWEFFAIKPSAYISGLCYSIFRLEPYTTCSLSCVYCYARWYRGPHGSPRPQLQLLRLWYRLAKQLEKLDYKPFFRLATLSEPLQDQEKVWMVSLAMLRAALRYKIPVVLNTKSVQVLVSPWLDLILALADQDLILVQVSLAFEDPTAAKLEPNAPPTSQRLEVIDRLAEHGVPVVARIQPLVPGLEYEHVRVAREALEAGARGLIGESLRATNQDLQHISRLLGIDLLRVTSWQPYQLQQVPGKQGLLHPNPHWRLHMHATLQSIATAYGRAYTACKEGIPSQLGKDCCQVAQHIRAPVMLRPTLYELAMLGLEDPLEACEKLGKPYTCSNYNALPKMVRRALKAHEARLKRLVKSEQHTSKLLLCRQAKPLPSSI